jgi:hypothetical protein
VGREIRRIFEAYRTGRGSEERQDLAVSAVQDSGWLEPRSGRPGGAPDANAVTERLEGNRLRRRISGRTILEADGAGALRCARIERALTDLLAASPTLALTLNVERSYLHVELDGGNGVRGQAREKTAERSRELFWLITVRCPTAHHQPDVEGRLSPNAPRHWTRQGARTWHSTKPEHIGNEIWNLLCAGPPWRWILDGSRTSD